LWKVRLLSKMFTPAFDLRKHTNLFCSNSTTLRVKTEPSKSGSSALVAACLLH
jgi:hypothetical protein